MGNTAGDQVSLATFLFLITKKIGGTAACSNSSQCSLYGYCMAHCCFLPGQLPLEWLIHQQTLKYKALSLVATTVIATTENEVHKNVSHKIPIHK